MELQGTETEKNLMMAFCSETINQNRYFYYSIIAKQEGFMQVSRTFDEISDQEKAHAKRLFVLLKDSKIITITENVNLYGIGTTLENLRLAMESERVEYEDKYVKFAQVAKQEGFSKISKIFDAISIAERYHESVFKKLLKMVEHDNVFKTKIPSIWKCLNCGYHTESLNEAPFVCPSCNVSQANFERVLEEPDFPLTRAGKQ